MADHSRPGTDTPLFYRGDLDDHVVTVNNGAKVNRDYAAFMQTGIWSTEKTWRIHERVHTITGYGLPNYTFVEGDRGLILFDTGINKDMGQELLKKKQEFSSKPIVAIIFRQTTLASTVEQGTATVSGDRDALVRFLKAYEGTL